MTPGGRERTARKRRDEGKLLARRLQDEARFIRTWLDKPLATGAISPSGPALARAMAAAVDPSGVGPVVELGPGTGPVTQALLERGIAEDRLILVEFDGDFCRLLRQRFPRATVIEGDAYRLSRTLRGHMVTPAAAIVSSLPLLTRPEAIRIELLRDAFDLMAIGAPFVQFTYGMVSPIPRQAGGFVAKVSPPVWLNLPPARVWVYRESESIAAGPGHDFFDRLIDQADQFCDEWLEKMRHEVLETTGKMRHGLRERGIRVRSELREQAGRVARDRRLQPTFDLIRKIGSRLDRPPV
jgi:phosphatidylethanolamine/phosphatidyl-N-methylethanolamine N-methyltransferase